MRGFEIEKTGYEITDTKEGLAEKILKVPGIALVAAGSASCLSALYNAAERADALDRLFLCEITSAQYSLGKQGMKIWQAAERAGKMPGIRGIIIYASCMEVLTMWDFERERKKVTCEVPVEILYRGPLVKRHIAPVKELEKIFDDWKIPMNKGDEAGNQWDCGKVKMKKEEISESEAFRKPQLPYFAGEIQKLRDQECDILLFTPGGCTGCLRSLPTESLRNVWNTRFTDYALSQGKLKSIAEEILQKFPEKRALYLLETEVLRFMGTDLKKVADYLNKAGKETHYIAERR